MLGDNISIWQHCNIFNRLKNVNQIYICSAKCLDTFVLLPNYNFLTKSKQKQTLRSFNNLFVVITIRYGNIAMFSKKKTIFAFCKVFWRIWTVKFTTVKGNSDARRNESMFIFLAARLKPNFSIQKFLSRLKKYLLGTIVKFTVVVQSRNLLKALWQLD